MNKEENRIKDYLKRRIRRRFFCWLFLSGSGLTLLLSLAVGMLLLIAAGSSNGANAEDCSAASTDVIVDKGMTENAKQIYSKLKSVFPEITPEGVSGMDGNFQQESRIDPKSVQSSNPTSGHGIAQWSGTRCTALMDYAKEKGKNWDDLDLQVAFMITELKGAHKGALEALRESDVQKATLEWEETFENAGNLQIENRVEYANHWYAVFGTNDPASDSTIDGGDSDGQAIPCDDSDTDNNDIMSVAKGWLGWFHYPHPDTHSVAQIGGDALKPDKEGTTDCSGYVWLVLNKANYKVPADMGWFTGTMTSDAREGHQWLKEVPENEAKAGDVVIVNQGSGIGGNGHTGILTEKWNGKATKIIQEGGNGDSVNIDTFGNSFMSLLNGGDICLARPIKK
ncbi:phage tail tip lysozyme [Enterococcus gilvus]|uniref:phage tail tip lysozyme n=1 Tax=Enterococcus gilvus TaxID=160453 RepID=UPI0028D10119|nr:phage tail tip lysozyme [Enterococcus gilvus]